MTRRGRRVAALLAGLLGVGCGAQGPPGVSGSEPGDVATTLVVAIDDLRLDHLAAAGYPLETTPHLSALAAGGTLRPHVVATIATTPLLATLFTGEAPWEHGLLSAREIGAHRLPFTATTLAEDFRARHGKSARTLAAVSLRQLEGRLCGLDQGFGLYLDADLPAGGGPRPAGEVVAAIRGPLASALAEGEPVFAFVHLGDLRGEGESPRFLEHHLGPFRGTNEAVDQALGRLPLDSAGAIEELNRWIGRRKGAPEWRAFTSALYDGAVHGVDEALGELLEVLSEADRFEDARILVVGTRGHLLEEQRPPEGIPEPLSDPLIRTVAVLRGGGATGTGPASTTDLHAWLFGAEAETDADPAVDPVVVVPGASEGLVLGRGGTRTFSHRQPDSAPPSWRTGFGFRGVPGVSLVAFEDGDPRRDVLRGDLEIPTRALRPSLRLRASWERPEERDEALLWIGEESMARLPVPRFPGGGPEDAVVRIESRGAGWRSLGFDPNLPAGTDVRGLLVAVPGDPFDGGLEVRSATIPGVASLDSRVLVGLDAVWVSGTTPGALEFRARPGRQVAFALQLGGRFVRAAEIASVDGSPDSSLTFHLPPWMPGRWDAFLGEAWLAPPELVDSPTAPHIRIVHRYPGRPLEAPLGLTEQDLGFLRRLGPYE